MKFWLLAALFFLTGPALANDLSPGEVVKTWIQLYGWDTAKAAVLTTDRFRKGEAPEKWAEKTHRVLQVVEYEHLGGKVIEEKISGELSLP